MSVSIYMTRGGARDWPWQGIAGAKELFCALKDLPFEDRPGEVGICEVVVRPTDFAAWRERIAANDLNVGLLNAFMDNLERDASLWLVFSY